MNLLEQRAGYVEVKVAEQVIPASRCLFTAHFGHQAGVGVATLVIRTLAGAFLAGVSVNGAPADVEFAIEFQERTHVQFWLSSSLSNASDRAYLACLDNWPSFLESPIPRGEKAASWLDSLFR